MFLFVFFTHAPLKRKVDEVVLSQSGLGGRSLVEPPFADVASSLVAALDSLGKNILPEVS